MKGIVLAGGSGTRLSPCTKVVNKQLLPVYNKPLVYYPILTLRDAGIDEILIIAGRGQAGQLLELLESGKELNVHLTYAIQERPEGIAHGLGIAEDFADNDRVALILGDNIFGDNLKGAINNFKKQKKGAKIILKQVPDPKRFGVARFNEQGDKIIEIIEKPKSPPSNWMVTGFYLYDNRVFDVIKELVPSDREEYEITDVNNFYVKEGTMTFQKTKGEWIDAGTFDALLRAGNFIAQREKEKKTEK